MPESEHDEPITPTETRRSVGRRGEALGLAHLASKASWLGRWQLTPRELNTDFRALSTDAAARERALDAELRKIGRDLANSQMDPKYLAELGRHFARAYHCASAVGLSISADVGPPPAVKLEAENVRTQKALSAREDLFVSTARSTLLSLQTSPPPLNRRPARPARGR